MLSNPVQLGLERMLPDWMSFKMPSGAKSLQQIMKLILLKLTHEILTMQISKHACMYNFVDDVCSQTYNIFECFKLPHFTTLTLNNPVRNAFIMTYRQF